MSSDEYFSGKEMFVAVAGKGDFICAKMPAAFSSDYYFFILIGINWILPRISLKDLVKPSDANAVSFEISHTSLAMIKLKSNVISFFLRAMWLSVSRYKQCSE